MKKGFTMIELIFVIVILGILAAVAIPRLAATRDDAEVAKGLTNLSTAITEVTSYYTAQSEFAPLSAMSNVAGFDKDKSSEKVADNSVLEIPFKVGTQSDCVTFRISNKNGAPMILVFNKEQKALIDALQDATQKNKATSEEMKKCEAMAEEASKTSCKKTLSDAVANAQKALNEWKPKTGLKGACGALLSTDSFKKMTSKAYSVGGSSVKF